MRAMGRIDLVDEDRERLEPMLRNRTMEALLALRGQMAHLAAEGLSNRHIGEELGIDDRLAMC